MVRGGSDLVSECLTLPTASPEEVDVNENSLAFL